MRLPKTTLLYFYVIWSVYYIINVSYDNYCAGPTTDIVQGPTTKLQSLPIRHVSTKDNTTGSFWADIHGPVVNPFDFKYIINNEKLCPSDQMLFYLIYVESAPVNIKQRQALRQTWARINLHPSYSSQLVFILGSTPLQRTIEKENRKNRDIIQFDFDDTYGNLTLKGIGAMKWVSEFCPHVKYVIKADDDIFVDMFSFIDLLLSIDAKENDKYLVCSVNYSMDILRYRKNEKCKKWCISDDIFPGQAFYPTYCSGAFYTFSRNVVEDIFQMALRTPLFWIEDIYITGILPRNIGDVYYFDASLHYTLNEDLLVSHLSKKPVVLMKRRQSLLWNIKLNFLSDEHRKLLGTEYYEYLLKESQVS